MLRWAIGLLASSTLVMVWGFNYRSDHPGAAIAGFFGEADPVYSLAGWGAGLGALAFLVGIGFLIAGLVRFGRTPEAPKSE